MLTGNKANGSVNLFSTQLGLTRTLQHSFKKQKHQELEQGQTKPLAHLKFKNVYENSLVKIMSKRPAPKSEPLFSESDLKDNASEQATEPPSPLQEESVPSPLQEESGSEDPFFGGLFEVTNSTSP